jgi:general secretion pathway protein D
MAALAQNAVVTADQNTNTIIVIAPPEVQQVYEQLIHTLDQRRPQVLVEVTLVTVDTSDSFTLGVELSGAQIGTKHPWLVFSSFGLSTMDLATGLPALEPGTGFNGIVVGSDTLNAVVQALAKNSRARVVAAPKVLVNDNASALLASISESPFTSVNASQTVSTTSFAGYASAGTTVAITPHISEGDHLQLRYSVTLNSFTGEGSHGIPPPRQTDTLTSEITMPNGSAVIVGGLKRKDVTQKSSKVPWLGDIPGLGRLFGLNSDTNKESTLFVFIRPVILRDDKFEDLKYLSDRDLEEAQLPPNAPRSDPLLMP